MGGIGSGRQPSLWRTKVEDCHAIDVNYLHRNGCLVAGRSGHLRWSQDDQRVAAIWFRAEENHLVLNYRARVSDGKWEDVKERIRLVEVPCRFGGSRPYFICPGVVGGTSCQRRVAKLYAGGRYFLCRHCHDLTYGSQGEDALSRALRRGNKIRLRLGGQLGGEGPFPPRPKGMWGRTYERLLLKAINANRQANHLTLDFIQRRFT